MDFRFKDRFLRKIGIGAIHIFRFTKLISHVLFYLFDVNCAFGFVSDYTVAASLVL